MNWLLLLIPFPPLSLCSLTSCLEPRDVVVVESEEEEEENRMHMFLA
jgi:hypothetical protein